MMSKHRFQFHLCVALLLLSSPGSPATAQRPTVQAADSIQHAKLILCFQGKGSFVAFDMGIAAEAYDQIPALKAGNVVITASSSGAIPAIYFSTHGFSDKSVEEGLDDIISCKSTFDAIRKAEDPVRKSREIIFGKNTEMSYNIMKEVTGRILDVDDWQSATNLYDIASRSKVQFCLPVAIVAMNHEVSDNSVEGSLFQGREEKVFVGDDFSVRWKPSVYDFYRSNPDTFARNNPDLKLGDSPYIGKACTYFVNEPMYDLLKQLPAQQRLADLRVMRTPRDIALALMASIGEPTYFEPVEEFDYSLLDCGSGLGDRGNSIRRSYAGGFAMPMVAQDMRRLLPQTYALGTGSYPFGTNVRNFLRAQYIVDTKATYALSNWWVDLHTAPRGPEWRGYPYGKLTPRDELQLGRERAREAFRSDDVFPAQVIKPKYCYSANIDDSADQPALETRRGLGELIQLQTSSAIHTQ